MKPCRKHSAMESSFECLQAALLATVLACLPLRAQGMKEDVEKYFADLKESVSAVMKDPAAKKTRLSQTDRFFVRSLKRHQTVYSFVRTNSKGKVISEVIRGKTPERDYRNVADQQWFKHIVRNNTEYHGFLKEEGRYYLFWAEPVILTASSGKKKFIGAVAAKVDLWDCFHKFSSSTRRPFLVRLGGKSLYSHKWEKGLEAREENLDIPGVDRISVLFKEGPIEDFDQGDSAALAQARAEAEAAAAAAALAEEQMEKPLFNMKSYTPLIIAGVVLLLLLIFALIRVIMWVRYKRLVKKIDKEDLL